MMSNEYDFWAALLIGFLSAGHCFGMCGGIVGAFSANLPIHHRLSSRHKVLYLITYNSGRILSYITAGALIGHSVSYFALKSSLFLHSIQVISGLMLIGIGLYIANWHKVIRFTEKLGSVFWPYISPISSRFVPFKSPLSALPFGFIWGWLPCGLVYSTLTWSAASGSALNGGLIMLGFGLGTLPAMLSMGFFSEYLKTVMSNSWIKIASALIIICYGSSLIISEVTRFII